MKKSFLLIACSLLLAGFAHAQKYAIIDTKYILDKMPEYKTAQTQLDNIAKGWQKEIDDLQQDLDKMYKNYDAEQVMLSDDLKKKREDQLFVKEKAVRDLQRQRFGFEGDLFKKRQELIHDFILDKSEGITVIFADPKLEKSDDVLRELGIK
jgi:outer membrane protein